MRLNIDGHQAYVATGGKPFDASLPTVVFVHGSGLDHRTWALQSRWFAFHGFSVLAPDLPAHSLSQGEALMRIEDMGVWLAKLIDDAKAEHVHLVGHSQGALVAMEAAPLLGERLKTLNVIASASSIPVNPALIDTAAKSSRAAARAMLQWGFGKDYRFGLSEVPGQAPIAIGQQIMQQNPLHADLVACNEYTAGNERAAQITVDNQLILARRDRMTPYKSGLKLADALAGNTQVKALEKVGHMLPMEAPKECLMALRSFIEQH